MSAGKCIDRGRFVAKVSAAVFGYPGEERIGKVTGDCGKHGRVECVPAREEDFGWCWEDFFGWDEPAEVQP